MYVTENKKSDPDSSFVAEELSNPGKSLFSSPLEVLSYLSTQKNRQHLRGILSTLSIRIFYEEYILSPLKNTRKDKESFIGLVLEIFCF